MSCSVQTARVPSSHIGTLVPGGMGIRQTSARSKIKSEGPLRPGALQKEGAGYYWGFREHWVNKKPGDLSEEGSLDLCLKTRT